jgi:cyclic-di-GMP phosphodiesterase TipF (flagellum assembly factor)
MMRLGAAFITLCMVLIAASLGAILYLSAYLSGVEAAIVAIAVLTALIVYNSSATRVADRADVSGQIADLSRGTADLARQVGEIGRRLHVVESTAAAAADKARAATEPLGAEIEMLGTLVKQLAESVAAHETVLAQAAMAQAASAAAQAAARQAPAAAPIGAAESAGIIDGPELDAEEPEQPGRERFGGADRAQVLPLIIGALDANRVDLHLQPIVSLPQRKVRFYEALTRLRTQDGEVLQPNDFLAAAEAGGLMPRIDNLILFRCVQVMRRLASKNRDIGIFCNISASTLNNTEFFPQLAEFMQANRALAPSLMLEFQQSALRTMGPIEYESLAALADLGFRFSLDRLTDLRIEPRELADRGFRFVKAPATLLLNRVTTQAVDIHPADLSDLLGRFGIDLIADRIESEGMVVDLLDYDVRFGQGFLFSPPRPVRNEALQGFGETGEALRPNAPGPVGMPRATPEPPLRAQLADRAQPAEPAPAEPAPTGAQRGDRRAGMLAQLARGVVRRA